MIRGFDYFKLLEETIFQHPEASEGENLNYLNDQYIGLRDMPVGYYFGVESKDITTKLKSIESTDHIKVEKKDELGNVGIDIKMGAEQFIFDSESGDWEYFDKSSGLSSFWRMEEATPGSVFNLALPDFIRRLKESLRDEEWTTYKKVEREVAPIQPGDIREVVTVDGEKRLVLVMASSVPKKPLPLLASDSSLPQETMSSDSQGLPPVATCFLIGDSKDLRFFVEEEDVYLRRSEGIPFPIIVQTDLMGSIGDAYLSKDRVGRVDDYTMMAIGRKALTRSSSGKVSVTDGDGDQVKKNGVTVLEHSDTEYFQTVPALNPYITRQDRIEFKTKELQALHRLAAATLRDTFEYLDEVE